MKRIFSILATFLFGVVATYFFIQITSAHGGNPNLIHGCVGTGVLNQGRLRVISASGTCQGNETPLDWNAQDLPGAGVLLTNINPNHDINLSGADFRSRNVKSIDLSGLTSLNSVNHEIKFDKAIVDGANFDYAELNASSFIGASVKNATFIAGTATVADFTNADLTNVNFSGTNLMGAIGMITATRTGIIWGDTTCPDGSNSDNNGNTCEGHL